MSYSKPATEVTKDFISSCSHMLYVMFEGEEWIVYGSKFNSNTCYLLRKEDRIKQAIDHITKEIEESDRVNPDSDNYEPYGKPF